MPNIMCTQRLWRLVRSWNPSAKPKPRQEAAHLSDWAATLFKEGDDTLVIAMEVQTYLTLVFPYGEGSVFLEGFSRALAAALDDFDVDPKVAAQEMPAEGAVCLTLLRDPQLREALETADFMCGIERSNHDDLRIVQRNLNRFPHNLPPDHVPALAVRRLFGRPPLRPA